MSILKNAEYIQEENSIDFLNKVFDCFNRQIPVVVVKKSAIDEFSSDSAKKLIKPEKTCGWFDGQQSVIDSDAPAMVAYSSGTESKPKAILLNHSTLANTVRRLIDVMEIDSSIREYIGVPVSYSFGFGRARVVAAVGGQSYIPKNGFNPVEIRDMLKRGEINAISAVPALWRVLLQNKDLIGTYGLRVKWIEIGSQYMSAAEKSEMKSLFPNAAIVQHYGLTEASRTTFLRIDQTDERYLESVGRMSHGVEVKINAANKILIRGGHVCAGLIVDDRVRDLRNDEGWIETNDLGHIEDGYLFYDGRSDDVVNIGGIKINPDDVQLFLEKQYHIHGKVAVTKYPDEVRGDGLLVALSMGLDIDHEQLSQALDEYLQKFSVNAKNSIKLIELSTFPVTETGKIKRKAITDSFVQHELQNRNRTENTATNGSSDVFHQISKVFGRTGVSPLDTFSGLGGDSMNYVQLTMLFEKHLGYIPERWEDVPFGELFRKSNEKRSFFSNVETATLLRVYAIIGVVLTHAGMTYAGGGTLLLFMLIGFNMARFKHTEFVEGMAWSWLKVYALKIIIPYTLLTAAYFVYTKSFDFTILLLLTNLIHLNITAVFPFWFVQALLQSLVIISLLLSIEYVRSQLRRDAWKYAFVILMIFTALWEVSQLVWDTSHLRNLVPQKFLPLIWLGYCFWFASSYQKKIVMAVCGVIVAVLVTNQKFTIHWIVTGCLLLALIPSIKIPSFMIRYVNTIAASTFYIFIFNGISIMFLYKVMGMDKEFASNIVISMVTVAAMLMCIAIWKVSEYLELERRVISLFARS